MKYFGKGKETKTDQKVKNEEGGNEEKSHLKIGVDVTIKTLQGGRSRVAPQKRI